MDQTFILDQFHVLEKLSDALKEMLSDEAKRKAAYARLKKPVKAGKSSQAIGELAPEAGRREKVAEFIGYCRSSLHRMRYDEYRRRGPPGSARSSLREAASMSSSNASRRAAAAGRSRARTARWRFDAAS